MKLGLTLQSIAMAERNQCIPIIVQGRKKFLPKPSLHNKVNKMRLNNLIIAIAAMTLPASSSANDQSAELGQALGQFFQQVLNSQPKPELEPQQQQSNSQSNKSQPTEQTANKILYIGYPEFMDNPERIIMGYEQQLSKSWGTAKPPEWEDAPEAPLCKKITGFTFDNVRKLWSVQSIGTEKVVENQLANELLIINFKQFTPPWGDVDVVFTYKPDFCNKFQLSRKEPTEQQRAWMQAKADALKNKEAEEAKSPIQRQKEAVQRQKDALAFQNEINQIVESNKNKIKTLESELFRLAHKVYVELKKEGFEFDNIEQRLNDKRKEFELLKIENEDQFALGREYFGEHKETLKLRITMCADLGACSNYGKDLYAILCPKGGRECVFIKQTAPDNCQYHGLAPNNPYTLAKERDKEKKKAQLNDCELEISVMRGSFNGRESAKYKLNAVNSYLDDNTAMGITKMIEKVLVSF